METLIKLCHVLNTEPNYLLASFIDPIMDDALSKMDDITRKQLAKLFLQGYTILENSLPPSLSKGK